MTQALRIVAITGSTHLPSRTLVLANAITDALEEHLFARTETLNLGDIARSLGGSLTRDEAPQEVEDALAAIEGADLLIVAAPVYRGSLPGLLKHLFDLIDQDALIDKPVLLAATGGSERHALVIDHQLRPLFSFFQSLTLPIGVYASTAEFDGYRVGSPALHQRIALAATRAAPLFAEHRLPQRKAA